MRQVTHEGAGEIWSAVGDRTVHRSRAQGRAGEPGRRRRWSSRTASSSSRGDFVDRVERFAGYLREPHPARRPGGDHAGQPHRVHGRLAGSAREPRHPGLDQPAGQGSRHRARADGLRVDHCSSPARSSARSSSRSHPTARTCARCSGWASRSRTGCSPTPRTRSGSRSPRRRATGWTSPTSTTRPAPRACPRAAWSTTSTGCARSTSICACIRRGPDDRMLCCLQFYYMRSRPGCCLMALHAGGADGRDAPLQRLALLGRGARRTTSREILGIASIPALLLKAEPARGTGDHKVKRRAAGGRRRRRCTAR